MLTDDDVDKLKRELSFLEIAGLRNFTPEQWRVLDALMVELPARATRDDLFDLVLVGVNYKESGPQDWDYVRPSRMHGIERTAPDT